MFMGRKDSDFSWEFIWLMEKEWSLEDYLINVPFSIRIENLQLFG